MSAGHPWTRQTPANDNAIITAVKWESEKAHIILYKNWDYPKQGILKYFILITVSTDLLMENTSVTKWLSSMDAILQMATTSTQCEWALFM
jgi:hypothetical protein